jgi:DNA-binding MarR family transcriptional regulator
MARKTKKQEKRYIGQSAVFIHKYIGHTRDQYFTMDKFRCNKAINVLNGNAFKLYVYLCQKSDNTQVLLSSKKFAEKLGFPKKSFIEAKKELIKRRYLIEREDGDYDFYNYQFHVVTEQEKIINEIIAKDKEKELAAEDELASQ